jgi:transcriptional regulator with XRE-family HTH domain
MMRTMNDVAIGRAVRLLRHRIGARQADIGRRAQVSQDEVSFIERGQLERVSLRRLRKVVTALDAELVMFVRWRAGDLDRLLDERHARLGGLAADEIGREGWTVLPEVTYSVFGERGSIDLLAWHATTRTLLVIEIKTEITSAEETLRRHDQKVRLARDIVQERFGWEPLVIGRLVVLPDSSTTRRQIERHNALFGRAYPQRNVEVRRFLRRPSSSLAGIWFLSDTTGVRGRGRSVARKRIRRPAGGSGVH